MPVEAALCRVGYRNFDKSDCESHEPKLGDSDGPPQCQWNPHVMCRPQDVVENIPGCCGPKCDNYDATECVGKSDGWCDVEAYLCVPVKTAPPSPEPAPEWLIDNHHADA